MNKVMTLVVIVKIRNPLLSFQWLENQRNGAVKKLRRDVFTRALSLPSPRKSNVERMIASPPSDHSMGLKESGKEDVLIR